MKKRPELAALANALLSQSKSLEPGPENSFTHMQQALQLLGSLEGVARESLLTNQAAATSAKAKTPAASAAAAALAARLRGRSAQPTAPTPASAPTAPHRPELSTTRDEYKPALRDQGVIEALLEFHRSAARSQQEAKPLSAFAPSQIPEVTARPKRTPAFRKGQGVSYPILRPTKPSNEPK